jgi:hypothetical protein
VEVGRVGAQAPQRHRSTVSFHDGHPRLREHRLGRPAGFLALLALAGAGIGVSIAVHRRSTEAQPTATVAAPVPALARPKVVGASSGAAPPPAARASTARPPAPAAAAASPRRTAIAPAVRPASTARGASPPPPSPPSVSRPTAAIAPAVSSSADPAPLPRAPLAHGGYVSGRTHGFVSADGRSLTNFVVAVHCAPKTTLPTIPIRLDGTFQFGGIVPGPPRTKVSLHGRFLDTAAASLRVRFLAPGCDSGVVRMTLRLS